MDIEGTVGSIDHVHRVLFPYARRRLAPWFHRYQGTDAHQRILQAVRDHQHAPALSPGQALELLTHWADTDTKAAPLKALQGLIWTEGFADGTLTGHLYPDVPHVLRRWHDEGIGLHIYSSGPATAQHDWFKHSGHGDLTPLIQHYFDLENTGGKRRPDSYRTALRAIGHPATDVLFLSDTPEELHAAATAGWRTVRINRDPHKHDPHGSDPRGSNPCGSNPCGSDPHGSHPTVASLDEIHFDAPPS
jgi:enolase-phosphatase E1